MPWTETLPSGLYRACWRDALGRQRSKSGFAQKAAALRFAGDQETRARGGQATYVGRTLTWGVWCDTWKPLRVIERTTADSDATRIERWLRPKWGTVPLGKITTEEVQAWVNELAGQMAPGSVAKVYGLLASSLKAAVKYKRLPFNPCQGVELPHPPPPDERFLTREEVDEALHHMIEPYRTGAILLVGTGMRFGEMAGLHRSRVLYEARAIDVFETWDGTTMKAYPKGRKKRRVPMPSWVAEALLELDQTDRGACGLPHGDRRKCRSDLIIRGPLGAPLDAHNMLQRHWLPALEKAKLPRARQHDLRHTTASWLIQAGRSMTEVAAVLGHSETAVTARYAHLAGTHMEAVRRVLEGHPTGHAPYQPHSDDSESAGEVLVAQ